MHISKRLLTLFLVLLPFLVFPVRAAAQCAGGQIDLLEYMGPDQGQNYDLRFCGPAGSGSEPIQVTRDTVQTTQGPKPGFFLNKGSNYEAYFYDNQYIYIYEDISWDEKCPNGDEAFYRVFTPGGSPGGRIPRCVSIGESFTSQQYIVGYNEAGYSHGDTGNVCNDTYSPTTISATIVSAADNPYAPDIPGSPPEDTIVMTNLSGAGAGEEKFYTKGYGLTAFRASDASGKVFFWSSFYKDGVSTSEPQLQCSDSSTDSSGGYDLSDFPDYDINPDEYYLQPISGMLSGQRDVDKIRKDLYSSGYEAYCAAEDVEVKPEYNTSGLINRYLQLHEKDPSEYPVVNMAVDSVAFGDMTAAKVPIWRDIEGKKFLMSSLEEFFSFKDVYTQNPSLAELNSAPINSLLSQEQRCVQSAQTLLATELMCEKLLDEGKCALLSQKVPGTGKIIDNLRQDMHKYMPTYRAGGISAECSKLYNKSIEHTEDELEFRKNLNNVPLEINRSYRLAFLVISIETKQPLRKSDSVAGKIFNFFTSRTEDGTPKHEVLVIGFKVPDIATNKGGGDDGGSVYWNDSAYLTRNVLLTREQIRDLEDNRRDIKRKQIGLQVEAAVTQNEESRIYCVDNDNPNGSSPACLNELGKAVVDMVNGAAYGCDTKEVEPVVQINDYAGFGDPKQGDVYKNEWGNTLLLNLFGSGDYPDVTHTVDNNYMDPQKAQTNEPWYEKIKTIWTIGPDTWSPAESKTVVNYYLVYPMGFELKEIESVMQNTFFTSEQRDLVEQRNRILDGWPIEGAQLGVAGGTASWDYPELLSVENCGTDATPEACEKHVSIAIETENKGIGYLGARLGFWLRQIQLSLNSAFSQTHNYISSCPTLEHFLLGQCAGGSVRQVGDGTDTDFNYDTCGLKLGTGYCAPDYLEPFFAEAGFENPALEAEKASRICQRESGSSPYAFNSNCLSGKSVDYSVGLFQINMLPRCAGAFADGTGVPDTASAYDPWKLPCHIVNQERLNDCALSKVAVGSFAKEIINEHLPPGAPEVQEDTLEQEKIKADNNIRAMVDLRKRWGSWQPWTAGAGKCSIE